MNIHQLEYFCVLAELQHYTKAAKVLSITQPTLTHSIKELEKELGVTLFNKEGRNVKINQYGQYFYQQLRPLLSELNQAKNSVQMMADPRRGVIHLSFLHSLARDFIPHIISEFLSYEENQLINFNLDQRTTSEIVNHFKENKTDVAFASKIKQKGVVSIPILKQELLVITPPNHPLARKEYLDLKDTRDYPYILYSEGSGLRPIIDELFENSNIRPTIAFEVDDDETVCGFVSAGLGIAIVPNIPMLEPVKRIRIARPNYERHIYINFCPDKYMSPAVKKFINFVIDKYATKTKLENLPDKIVS